MATTTQRAIFDGRTIKTISLSDFGYALDATASTAPADVRRLADSVAWLYRCVQVRAAAVAALPWVVQRGDAVVWDSQEATPPQPLAWLDNLIEMLFLTESSLTLTGSAFWFLPERRVDVVRWLTPWTVTPVWSENGLQRFERSLPTGQRSLPTDRVAWFRLPGLHETMAGNPPAATAAAAARLIYNVDVFAAGFFERGAIPAVLLSVAGNPPQSELTRLEEWWRRLLRGARRAWETVAVRADVTPQVIGQPIGELAMPDLIATQRQDIATALGVPQSLVESSAANFAVAQADRLNFYDFVVLPEAMLIARTINRQVLRGTPYEFKVAPERLAIYQENEQERANAFATYVGAGLAASVAAQIVGVQLPDAMDYSALDRQPLSPEQIQRQHEATALRRWLKNRQNKLVNLADFHADYLDEHDKLLIASETKALIVQSEPGGDDDDENQAAHMEVERSSTDRIADALATQQRRTFASSPTSVEDALQALDANVEPVQTAIRRSLIDAADAGVREAVRQLATSGIGFDWSLANTAARDWSNQHVAELMPSISDTTRRQVRQAVAAWIENGAPLEALIQELEPTFGRARAELIASTEVTRAYAQGTIEAYREAGVVQRMRWRTARDEIVCPICGKLNGVEAAIDARFINPDDGLEYLPPAHPRCRCWITPVVAT